MAKTELVLRFDNSKEMKSLLQLIELGWSTLKEANKKECKKLGFSTKDLLEWESELTKYNKGKYNG